LLKDDLYVGCLFSSCFEQKFQDVLSCSGSSFSSLNFFPLEKEAFHWSDSVYSWTQKFLPLQCSFGPSPVVRWLLRH